MRRSHHASCLPLLMAAGLLLGGTAAQTAFAEDDLPPTSEFFDEYDSNADGKVTKDEFRGTGEIFRLLDKNEDGSISPDELGLPADYKPDLKAKQKRERAAKARGRGGDQAKRAAQFRKRVMTMDADKDGRVSKEEWSGPAEAFARIDRNKDGFIDAKDRPQRKERGGKRGGKNGSQKDGGMEGEGHTPGQSEQMLAQAKQRFAEIDKNKDGQLSADELPNPRMLAAVDHDKNGTVSEAEFLGFVKRRGQGGGRKGRGEGDARKKRGGRGMSSGMLRRWDRDRDGKVSADEFPGRDEMFQRFDTDKDGFLTKADIKAAKALATSRPSDQAKPKAPVTSTGGSVIEVCDTDGDGKLHRAEFKGSAADWRRLDKNDDGWVTQDELAPGK